MNPLFNALNSRASYGTIPEPAPNNLADFIIWASYGQNGITDEEYEAIDVVKALHRRMTQPPTGPTLASLIGELKQ